LKSFPQKLEHLQLLKTINAHRGIHGGQETTPVNASPIPENQPITSPKRRQFAGKLWIVAVLVVIFAVSAFATSMVFLLPPSFPTPPLNATGTVKAGIYTMFLG
jgi:hypothetical protein